jgi:hypothetical protein
LQHTILQAKLSQTRVIVRSGTKLGPEKFSVFTPDGHVVDACFSPVHQAVVGKLPEFISAGPEPVAGIVVVLILETHRDAVAIMSPEFFIIPN